MAASTNADDITDELTNVRVEKKRLLCQIEQVQCRSAAGVYSDLMCQAVDQLQLEKCGGNRDKLVPFRIPPSSNNNTPLKEEFIKDLTEDPTLKEKFFLSHDFNRLKHIGDRTLKSKITHANTSQRKQPIRSPPFISARCIDTFSPEDSHFWMAVKESKNMAVKESKNVTWNENYGKFQKLLHQLTPTETQEKIAKEEIKKRLDNNNIGIDLEAGTEKVIKRRKKKPIAPANVGRLWSLRKRGVRMLVDDARNVSGNPMVAVDMGEKPGQLSRNLPNEHGLIWNGETWEDWLDAAQKESSTSAGSFHSNVISPQTPSPVAEQVDCVDGNDVYVFSSSSSLGYVQPVDQAVVSDYGDGHAAVSNMSDSRQCSPSFTSSEDRHIKFMRCEKQLSAFLRAIDLELVHVPADGNCLFSALALHFYGVRDYQRYIRQAVVEQMQLRPAVYENFHTSAKPFTEYVKELAKDGTYGDDHVLAAFANEFEVSVKVFQPDGSHLDFPFPESHRPTVLVAYNSFNHYYGVKDVGRGAVSVGEGVGEEVENHRDDEHLGRTTKGMDNGVSLQGRSNTEAMEGLRRAVHQEGPKPGHITLTVARKMHALKDREVTLEGQSQDDTQNSPVHLAPGEVVSIDGDYLPQSRPRPPSMMMMSTSNGSSTPDTTMNLPWQQQQQHSNNNIRGPGGKRSGPTDGRLRRRRRRVEQPQPLPETSMRSDGRHSDSAAPTYTSQNSLDTDPNAPGFSRDQFGRQSMSENRHASMDAKNTDTYQRNKKLREERERQKQTQPERKTGPFGGDEAPTTTSTFVPLQETVTSIARNKESTSTGTGNVVRPPTKKSLGMTGVRRTFLNTPKLRTITP